MENGVRYKNFEFWGEGERKDLFGMLLFIRYWWKGYWVLVFVKKDIFGEFYGLLLG